MRHGGPTGVALLLPALLLAGCDRGDDYATVAPLLHEHCAGCHRPGGSGPFDLIEYRDALKFADQIADVIQSGYMPPWLPSHSDYPLADDRRMSEDEIERLLRWVRAGRPAGDPATHPAPPAAAPEWPLGSPDLVLEMAAPFDLPAAGRDVYRNFVLRGAVSEARWVRAVSFRTASPKVIHHARILIDRSGAAAAADGADGLPGYDGMDSTAADNPDGILLGWTPGKPPHPGYADLAWRFDAATDVVTQLHMVPSGKPETVHATLGLYFADGPPTRRAYSLVLGSRDIDIAAGERDHDVSAEYTLPVDVELAGVYPHAHYLATAMNITAELPGGERRTLLRIDDWDFDWQDEYRFVEAALLPAGTTLRMDYRYDNSDENVRNPTYPARRVGYGPQTDDEMAEVAFQLVPARTADYDRLREDHDLHRVREAIAYRRARIAGGAAGPADHAALGAGLLRLGDLDAAVAALRQAGGGATVDNNLGFALLRSGRPTDAVAPLERALAEGGGATTRFNLGEALRAAGRPDDALRHYREALRLRPDTAGPLNGIARILATHPVAARRNPAEALRLARRAHELAGGGNPEIAETLRLAEAAN